MRRFESVSDILDLLSQERIVDPAENGANVELMREFLRREALWAKQIGLDFKLPFADLAGLICPKVSESEFHRDEILEFSSSLAETKCLSNAMKWVLLREKSPNVLAGFHLPAPYDPLLTLLARGGCFSQEHGVFVSVGESGVHAGIVQNGPLDEPFVHDEPVPE